MVGDSGFARLAFGRAEAETADLFDPPTLLARLGASVGECQRWMLCFGGLVQTRTADLFDVNEAL